MNPGKANNGMELHQLHILLGAQRLELEHKDDGWYASSEQPLTLLVLAGSELLRFAGVEHVHLAPELTSAGLCGLVTGEKYTVVAFTAIVAVERQGFHREKRRTGFL